MLDRRSGSLITVAVAAAAFGAVVSASITQTSGQAGAARPARIEGKPNFSGIWQANNEANWDLQAHAALPGAVTQRGVYPYDYARVPAAPVVALGAAGAVPGSLGVVQGDGQIPYKPEALQIKKENAEHWIDRDPELKCYLPGIPRAMYLPYPFQITQSTNKIHIAYEFSNSARTGDFHSDALHLTERFSLMSPDVIQYDVTIEDPKVFTRPWRIAMPLYRRVEPNMQLLEFRCNEFVEEFMYGNLRKEPLVKHWEGETMAIDITRKIPPGDRFYEWYR